MSLRHPHALAALLLVAPLSAQVPDGWAVASAFQSSKSVAGGLSVMRPHAGAVGAPILGLPSDLTTYPSGANAVLVHPTDGRVLVGEITRGANDTLEIHELTLRGLNVVRDVRHVIGRRPATLTTKTAVDQMAWLPDGRVLLTHVGTDNPGLAGTDLAILDLKTGALTPVATTGGPSPVNWFVNALAIDARGTTAYVAYGMRSGPAAEIHAVSLPGGGPMRRVATHATFGPLQLEVDDNGDLLMAAVGPGTPGILRWNGSTWSTAANLGTGSNGMTRDPISGDLVLVLANNLGFERVAPSGARTVIGAHALGNSVVSGIAIAPSMVTYGQASANAYRWAITPSPSGLPTLGNRSFDLTVTTAGATGSGVLLVGTRRTSTPVLGFELQVVPDVVLPLASARTQTVPVPIPDAANLAGLRLHAQTVHAIGGRHAGSAGLRFTVY